MVVLVAFGWAGARRSGVRATVKRVGPVACEWEQRLRPVRMGAVVVGVMSMV
jgi:hypothetical protein